MTMSLVSCFDYSEDILLRPAGQRAASNQLTSPTGSPVRRSARACDEEEKLRVTALAGK